MKKFILYLTLALVCLSCTKSKPKYVIGVSQCSGDIWRDKLNEELHMGTYFHDDVELLYASADDNDEKQIEQIDAFVSEGINLLIVSPNQVATISPAIDRAYDRGIPVIVFDRKTSSKKFTAYIGADNEDMGHEMGEYIAAQLQGKGRVLEIMGLKGSSPAIERHQGFVRALQKYPGIQLVASLQGDWTEDSGRKAIEELRKTDPEKTSNIDYVFGQNDRMAVGAYHALDGEHNRQTRFCGIDALPNKGGGMECVRDGILTASYIYPTHGDEVLQLAVNILEGKSYEKENPLKGALVTKNNAHVLLMQNEELTRQKGELDQLHMKVDDTLTVLNNQNVSLITLIIIVGLLVALCTYAYWAYLTKARYSQQLRESYERQRQLTTEIEEMTKAQLMFFTNVSHEFRTPLTLIADPVDHLLDDQTLTGSNRNLLEMVRRNVHVLMQLVNEVLDFRKVQSGKMELQLSSFDLREAVAGWSTDFEATAWKKNIRLVKTLPDVALPIEADLSKVARIYFNLMSNALKFTPEGGTIQTRLQHIGDNYTLTVTDSGIGMDENDRQHVFDRFYQTKGTSGGTGIGLSLVKSFAELHHGTATVDSRKGEGSAFTVSLPCRQPDSIGSVKEEPIASDSDVTPVQYVAVSPQPTTDTAPDVSTTDTTSSNTSVEETNDAADTTTQEATERPTILVIDDNPDVRDYLRTILTPRYNVAEAPNGEAGLQEASREVPDLVVCDIMMPVMNGLEFCNRMKSETATSHIPVILLTARTLESQQTEGYEHGADSYITKPFSSRLLLARIDNLLSSRIKLKALFATDSHELAAKEQLPTQQLRTTEEQQLNATDKAFIDRLRSIIEEHMADSDFGVEVIGTEIGLSRVQLYRKVKALTGSTPVDLIRKARLSQARQLLQTTGKSVSEVAYTVGFSAPSYFTKCFKEEYGMLPNEVAKS